MRFGILGSGSWATALAKVLTDNGHPLSWYVRSAAVQEHLLKRKHNPHYLPSVDFSTQSLSIHTTIEPVIEQSEVIVIAVPSAYLIDTLSVLTPAVLAGKKILS
ncbi:MAG: NAD(P)-binding domain-containing protein, partial [Chitinophagaceae bacterium]